MRSAAGEIGGVLVLPVIGSAYRSHGRCREAIRTFGAIDNVERRPEEHPEWQKQAREVKIMQTVGATRDDCHRPPVTTVPKVTTWDPCVYKMQFS
jgi:hypothetical protein